MSKHFPHYPIYLDVEGRTIVIVGGGGVAERKVATLLRYGADITVVSPEFASGFDRWRGENRVRLLPKRYEPSDLEGAFLVIASTDQQSVNAQVAADSRRLGILVNVTDDPGGCDFIVPAIIERGPVQVAVSTGGQSPALARRIRERLESVLGVAYGEVSDIMGALREPAQTALPTDGDRKRFFDALLASGVIELLGEGLNEQALEAVRSVCGQFGIAVPEPVIRKLGAG